MKRVDNVSWLLPERLCHVRLVAWRADGRRAVGMVEIGLTALKYYTVRLGVGAANFTASSVDSPLDGYSTTILYLLAILTYAAATDDYDTTNYQVTECVGY